MGPVPLYPGHSVHRPKGIIREILFFEPDFINKYIYFRIK